MAKKPNPMDDAEVVRQMELLEGVVPSDVTLPEQGDLTDQDQAMLERHRAMERMLDNAYKDKVPVEEMVGRARERHRETQRIAQESLSPLTETGLSDLVPTLDTLRNLPETSGNLFSNMFNGLGAVGTAFKGLGKGLFGAATGKPMENERPTIFDAARFTPEEIKEQFDKLETTDAPRDQKPSASAKPSSSERVARMAEDAVKKTGKEIFSAADAPELFAATSFSSDNDGTRKIIELLETLPSRISEELKS